MPLPSIFLLASQIQKTLRRFPLASITAFLATALALYAVEVGFESNADLPWWLLKSILLCGLGFPVFLAATLIGEDRKWTAGWRAGAATLCAIFLAFYFAFLPDLYTAPSYHLIRYVLLFLSFTLTMTVAAFVGKGNDRDFWSFNRYLFQGFALSGIFAGTLCVGIFIAMASVDYLFEVRINGKYYLDVWIVLAGVVATQIFLSRIPSTFSVKENEQWYPAVVRMFAQYILVPLIGLYTAILSLYSVKILLTGVWPKGQVCSMVLGYAAIGIVADMLLSPVRGEKKFRWVRPASKIYYTLLALFCLLLYGAVWQRIVQYGITENRYFVVLFGTWTLGIALFFLLRKTYSIKLIPITLSTVLLLSSFGPWSAFTVSRFHQYHRLESVLNTYHLLKDGVIIPPSADPLTIEDRTNLSAIVDYLYTTHGIESLQPYFSFDLHALHEKAKRENRDFFEWNFPARILEEVGITHRNAWNRNVGGVMTDGVQNESFRYELDKNGAIPIGGYTTLFPLTGESWPGITHQFKDGARTFELTDSNVGSSATVSLSQDGKIVATFDLRKHLKIVHPRYDQSNGLIPAKDMRLTDGAWSLLLQDVSYNLRNGDIQFMTLTGWLMRR